MSFFVTRQYVDMLVAEREREMRNRRLERIASLAAECCDAARSRISGFVGFARKAVEPAVQPAAACACE